MTMTNLVFGILILLVIVWFMFLFENFIKNYIKSDISRSINFRYRIIKEVSYDLDGNVINILYFLQKSHKFLPFIWYDIKSSIDLKTLLDEKRKLMKFDIDSWRKYKRYKVTDDEIKIEIL